MFLTTLILRIRHYWQARTTRNRPVLHPVPVRITSPDVQQEVRS